MPIRDAYALLNALPIIEYRRHVHTATLTALVEGIVVGKGVNPSNWLHSWANPDEQKHEPLESPAVLRDMALARKTDTPKTPFCAAELVRWHHKYGERIHELMDILNKIEV
jgi:hypothetical protein